jgi:hypothetical protein
VDGMEWSYDPRKEQWRPDVTLLQIATGTAGQTVEIPAVPPDGGYGYPDLELPPLPEFPGGGGGVGPTVPTTVLFHDQTAGMIVAYSFDGTPRYETINAGLTVTQRQRINWVGLCPNGALYVAYLAEAGSGAFIARAPSIGAPFEILYEHTNSSADDPNALWSIGINLEQPEQVAFIRGPHASKKIYVGSYGSFTAGASISSTFGISNNGLSFGLNQWLLTYYDNYARISASGGSVLASGNSPSYAVAREHLRAGTTGKTYHPRNGADGFLTGENNLTTLSLTLGTNVSFIDNDTTARIIDCDTSGQYLMGAASSVSGKAKSTDFGASWSAIANLPAGNWSFGYAGKGASPYRFIAAGAVVRYTPDFGSSWLTKENSSLTDITPFPNINIVKFVG